MKRTSSSGYSGKSLVEKLGITSGSTIVILNAPPDYKSTLGKLPADVAVKKTLTGGLCFIHFFTVKSTELGQQFPRLKKALFPDGMLWISWPKGSSSVPTDLNENIVREIGLRHGLVDVKVCAVDQTWSGLKFVYRVKDRT